MTIPHGSPSLEVRHLVAFRAVAAERSFGRAAAVLGYTQSGISQQIASLERTVGEPLFERPGGPRPVELTRAGELLLPHAEAILERIRAAESDMAAFRAGHLGRLAVGAFQSVSVRILPEVLRRFRIDHPGIDVSPFESDDQDELLRALAAGDLDLTFLIGPTPAGDHELVDLASDEFVVLSAAEAALAPQGGAVPVAAITGLPLIGQSASSPCQLLIEQGLRAAGAEVDIVFRTGDNSAVQAMVRSGIGHAVMPLLTLDLNDAGVAIRRLDPPIPPRHIQLAVSNRRRESPAVEAFIAIAQEVCGELVPRYAPAV